MSSKSISKSLAAIRQTSNSSRSHKHGRNTVSTQYLPIPSTKSQKVFTSGTSKERRRRYEKKKETKIFAFPSSPTTPVIAPPKGSSAEGELCVSTLCVTRYSSSNAMPPELSVKTETQKSLSPFSFRIFCVAPLMYRL